MAPDGDPAAFYLPLSCWLVYAVRVAQAAARAGTGAERARRLRIALLAGLHAGAADHLRVSSDLIVDLVRIVLCGRLLRRPAVGAVRVFELLIGRIRSTQPLPVAERSADSSSG